VTSSNERREQKGFNLSDNNRYYSEISFGTELEHQTATTAVQNMRNSLNVKVQDGGRRHLEFRKMSIKIVLPNLVGKCITAIRR